MNITEGKNIYIERRMGGGWRWRQDPSHVTVGGQDGGDDSDNDNNTPLNQPIEYQKKKKRLK